MGTICTSSVSSSSSSLSLSRSLEYITTAINCTRIFTATFEFDTSISMSLSSPNSFLLHHKLHKPSNPSASGVSLHPRLKIVSKASTACWQYEGTKERIKKMFDRVELSVSSYDTAWVAMVPSPNYPETACFPNCVNWLLDNQLNDGSWGLLHCDPLLIKDALSSTLACVLALKRWGVGEEQINKGLHFIKSNFDSSTDEKLHSPIGFDIIFPGMIEYGKALNLNLHLGPTVLDDMLYKRDLELKRSCGSSSDGRNAYLAYVSEGLGNLRLHDWKMVMKYQRKNGSLFNSPSTTAAALIHLRDPGCLDYLRLVLNMFGNAVPTVYPLDIYARLSMVDNLVRLGIDRHFKEEIISVLDMTYRSWLQKDEEIFSDLSTCAMAFRILRLNGYDVSPDPLTQLSDGDHYFASFSGHPKDMHAALELFRASEIIIYPDESALEKTNVTSSKFLKQELLNASIEENKFTKKLRQQVDDALKFRHYADLERLENRRYIKHYNIDSTRNQKTLYCSPNISNEDFLKLAVEDFNICQSIHRGELKELARWIVDSRLDQLKFARQKLAYCYFSGAATLFSPELKDARISWAKNGVLTTVVDDFFDVGGSEEELVNLIELVKKWEWDVNLQTDCCSDQVVILFSALHSTISEIDDRAVTCQGRSVKSHIMEIWLDLLNSMLREADWARNKFVPTMDEYMTNAYVSMALGPTVLLALYLVGPKLSEEVVRTPEYHNLFKLISTCGRLLNDFQGYKREIKQGKLNAVTLRMIHSGGLITEEDAIKEIKSTIESNRRELLRLVLQEKNSVVPRACKDLFWKMSKVLHLFYVKDDGFTSDEMINDVKEVMYEPIVLKDL